MSERLTYKGKELELFEQAVNWKQYFAGQIKPYISGRVLEVGAGLGQTTNYLMNAAVSQWTCLEPDHNFAATLRRKVKEGSLPHNCVAIEGTIDTLTADQMFQTIVYIDVLEHIEDDAGELQKALSHLLPDGHLVVLSPALPVLYCRFDKEIGHYRRYTKMSLRAVTNSLPLKEKKLIYLDSAGAVLLFAYKLFSRKIYPSKQNVWLWQKLFVSVSKVADRVMGYRLGKTIAAVWQKQKQ